MSIEIEPCECGCTPILVGFEKQDTLQRFVRIWCPNCGAYLSATTVGGSITDEEAIDAWNRRQTNDRNCNSD